MEFFMVSIDEEAYKVKPFVEKNRYVVPVLYSDAKVQADYKVIATPMTLLIDPEGRVQLQGVSPHRNENRYKDKIEELLRATARSIRK